MIVLGIDPGATTGWCSYDTETRCAVMSGCFLAEESGIANARAVDRIAIERPKGYGPTRPQVVDCAYVCGRLVERFGRTAPVEELTRIEVKSILREATHGEVSVKNDAGVWAAVLLLHGGEAAAKKGGPLHGVKSHARAALAVAVAWALRQGGK